MIPQLQITCHPDDWDTSVILAAGIPLPDGRTLAPRSVVALDLPADLLAIWHGAVAQISGIDPGGWAARHIVATRGESFVSSPSIEEGEEPDCIAVPHLALTIRREWLDTDARALATAPDISLTFDDPAMLHFFDALTAPGYWFQKSPAENPENL